MACGHVEYIRSILRCHVRIDGTMIATYKIYAVFIVNCDEILGCQASKAPNDWQVS